VQQHPSWGEGQVEETTDAPLQGTAAWSLFVPLMLSLHEPAWEARRWGPSWGMMDMHCLCAALH